MSLLESLPAPARVAEPPRAREVIQSKSAAAGPRAVREVPPYGRRRGYVPRRLEDFGDGGAFPEIHVAQYPRNIGRADKQGKASDGKTLALTVNADGELNYDAILRAGQRKDKVIFSKHDALVPKVDDVHQTDPRPDQEEIHESTKETWNALQRLVDSKIQAAQPKTLPAQPGPAEYIKYTPSQTGSAFNSGASTRIIRMQDLPVDPLEPPKFRHKKVPRGAGSPPVPVMHSPPRPLTVKDQQDWKIPPCISNWKNPKGYTIPLDKRLAADGRGMQEMQVNDNFAALSAALYTAENEARREVEITNRMKQEQAKRRKEQKEKELRELALKARMERYGAPQAGPTGAASRLDDESEPAHAAGDDPAALAGSRAREREEEEEEEEHAARSPRRRGRDDDEETAEERRERKQRDQFREERRRERERERRLEAKDAQGFKRSKLTRDRDRDISEKVALGQANVAGSGQVVYDSRLFNQDQGMAAGFGSEDAYNLYDKPLFADRGGVFKPSSRQDDDAYGGGRGGEESVRTSKFKPDQGFSGTDAGGAPRSEPVQFERNEAEADPFGLDQFLSDVKSGSKQQRQRR